MYLVPGHLQAFYKRARGAYKPRPGHAHMKRGQQLLRKLGS